MRSNRLGTLHNGSVTTQKVRRIFQYKLYTSSVREKRILIRVESAVMLLQTRPTCLPFERRPVSAGTAVEPSLRPTRSRPPIGRGLNTRQGKIVSEEKKPKQKKTKKKKRKEEEKMIKYRLYCAYDNRLYCAYDNRASSAHDNRASIESPGCVCVAVLCSVAAV